MIFFSVSPMQYLEHIYTKILCVVYLKFKYNWAYGYFMWQLYH